MKKRLFLIGAGDLGREMESWLDLLPNFHHIWEIIGYLDQNPDALKNYPSNLKIVGSPVEYDYKKNDHVILCLTNPASKQLVVEKVRNKVSFFSFIAPNAIVGKFVKLGKGVIVCPNTCVSTNVALDDFVFLNAGTQIGHDCRIGEFSSLMSNVDLGGRVKIGRSVYIGTNATVIPGKTVNDNITIGTGSIVIQSLEKEGTYFGNPATLLGF